MNDSGHKNTTTTGKPDTTETMTKDNGTTDMKQNKTGVKNIDVNDGENANEPVNAETDEQVEDDIETIKQELETARKEAADSYDRLLRMTADFENYKKRSERERQDQKKFANESIIKDLLPVVDNLERALLAAEEQQVQETGSGNMVEGVEMTLKEILKILEKYGVTSVEAQGKPFDPVYHEAVMQEESNEYPENTVVNELQKGYMLHDRLIRPAMVVVSKGSQNKNTNETK